MTSSAKHGEAHRRPLSLDEANKRVVEQFARLVTERVKALAPGSDGVRFVKLAKQALREARASLDTPAGTVTTSDVLPVSRLKASDVISQGWVQLSQATLYRAVEARRFYCTAPKGRSIGREFPAWQFVEPVPELIASILAHLAQQPRSEIHAFWVTASEELNALSPAEVLAGKPFETRSDVHHSQQALIDLPSGARVQKVQAVVTNYLRSMADVIG
jgi:predicted DNA-binding transcriptional regulator AlpA